MTQGGGGGSTTRFIIAHPDQNPVYTPVLDINYVETHRHKNSKLSREHIPVKTQKHISPKSNHVIFFNSIQYTIVLQG